MRKLFKKFGKIIDISIPRHLTTGKAKGFAFIEFENKNMGLKAIKVFIVCIFDDARKLMK